jgi:hypothetical protein
LKVLLVVAGRFWRSRRTRNEDVAADVGDIHANSINVSGKVNELHNAGGRGYARIADDLVRDNPYVPDRPNKVDSVVAHGADLAGNLRSVSVDVERTYAVLRSWR